MFAKRFVNALIGSVVLAFAAMSTALAADSGYQTIYWTQGNDQGEIHFILNNNTAIYYKCEDADLIEPCRAILLTALSTAREVKAFYTVSGTSDGSSTYPYLVTALRIH